MGINLEHEYDATTRTHYLVYRPPAVDPGPARVVVAKWSADAYPGAFVYSIGSIGKTAADGRTG